MAALRHEFFASRRGVRIIPGPTKSQGDAAILRYELDHPPIPQHEGENVVIVFVRDDQDQWKVKEWYRHGPPPQLTIAARMRAEYSRDHAAELF